MTIGTQVARNNLLTPVQTFAQSGEQSPAADPNTALLRALLEQIAGLRAELRRYHVDQADKEQTALVDAARAGCAGRTFVVADLFNAALRGDETGLRLAALIGKKEPRAVGHALRAASNKRTDDGLVLRRVGNCNAGAIWCVSIE